MKYLCLIYHSEANRASYSKEQGDTLRSEYLAFTDDIRKSGHLLGAEALQPTQAATTVRVRNGKVSVTDGPFAETKECLAGFYLMEARDLNEAIQLASRIPPAEIGSIEVRPVRTLDVS